MHRFVVTNERSGPVRLVVEPWGDFVTLAPGDSHDVDCSETASGYVSVVVKSEQIEMWAEGDRAMEVRLRKS
jgi:hypothetical protein